MNTSLRTGLLAASILLTICSRVIAQDYVRLRDGRIVTCAVLRQDTAAVITTDWQLRHLAQPPLQVYSRDEVESIWFVHPAKRAEKIPYLPHPLGIEGGGSVGFQTWSGHLSSEVWSGIGNGGRSALLLSLFGGFTFLPQMGMEAEADFTFPMGGKSDPTWSQYAAGRQVILNVVAHPISWHGIVPFAVLGGGASLGIPIGSVLLPSDKEVRNLVDAGLGVKWGSNGIGYRVEWRHNYYWWTPDVVTASGLRAPSESVDSNLIRASLFIYR